MKIVKSIEEIENLLDRAMEASSNGTMFPGMTYEEGIVAVIDWITGRSESEPLEE